MTMKFALALAAVVTVAGCGSDRKSPIILGDTGVGDAGPGDTGTSMRECGTPTLPSCPAGQMCNALGRCVPTTTMTCQVGNTCMPARGCSPGLQCYGGNAAGSTGGAGDPITGYPPGDMTPISTPFLELNYCTPAPIAAATDPAACDPNDSMACGACAACEVLFTDDMGVNITMCVRTCVPSLTENTCPGTSQCILGQNFCFDGCGGDDECRVQRRDTNMNGMSDPYDPMTNPMGDHLVYDASTNARCNLTTFRCEHDGVPMVEAGANCTNSFECEPNGACLSSATFPGGLCTKFGCDTPGNACAGGGVCQSRRIGVDLCFQGCTVAAEAAPEQLGLMGHAVGCPVGYACYWGGAGGAGVADNGICFPGEYNAIAAPNIGAPCMDSAECYSPFGQARCLTQDFGPSNYCTVLDCGAPGMPVDVCGPGNTCGSFGGDFTGCVKNCTSAADCNPGHACVDFDGMATTPKVCWVSCSTDADCRTTEMCNIPMGEMLGSCV